MSNLELIKLVEKIQHCEGTEQEIDNMIELLEKNVPNQSVSNLIFYRDDLTSKEIVELALSYKAIIL